MKAMTPTPVKITKRNHLEMIERFCEMMSAVHGEVHHTWAEMIAAEHWENNMPTNALLISGPSKTADIQQTLAYGAHGPKELIVLMI